MIKLITSLLMLFVLITVPKAHAEEPFINDLEIGALGIGGTMAFIALGNHAQDKKTHGYAGLIPGVWGTIIFKKARWGFGIGCGITILKEVIDHNKWLNENSVADIDDAKYGCGAALSGAYFTKKVIVYQHNIDTGIDVQLVEKPNTYVGMNFAFSTGQY